MKTQELGQLKEELLERLAKIEILMEKQEQQGKDLIDYNEMNDVMSKNDESAGEISDLLSDFAITETLEKTLKDIKQALTMMERGDYGVCKYCKTEIPIERMRVRPVSTSCVDCKSKFTT